MAAGSSCATRASSWARSVGRLRQRALGRRALAALDLGLRQRVVRLAHRVLGSGAQPGRLLAGRLPLGGRGAGQRREALQLGGRLLGGGLGGLTGGDLLVEAGGGRLRLGACCGKLGHGLLELLDLRARLPELRLCLLECSDLPVVRRAQLLELGARRARLRELGLERRHALRRRLERRDVLGRLGRRALELRDAALGLLRAGAELGLALGVGSDLRAQVAAAGGRVLDREHELARALLEIDRAALGIRGARRERARPFGRGARGGGLLLGAPLELGGVLGGGALDLGRALALRAQALRRLGQRGVGLRALGGDRGRLLLGRLREVRPRPVAFGGERGGVLVGGLGGGPLAPLGGLLELGDARDEPLGLRARRVELRDLVERAQVLVAQLLELDAVALRELLGLQGLALGSL